jgi:hypothetical protein
MIIRLIVSAVNPAGALFPQKVRLEVHPPVNLGISTHTHISRMIDEFNHRMTADGWRVLSVVHANEALLVDTLRKMDWETAPLYKCAAIDPRK